MFYKNSNANDEIKILNTLGESVIKTKSKNKIDVSSLQNGIYFVDVSSENKEVIYEKLIITK
ncbi:MAG: T9SS type A sorting domain-containing protein [Bacteroidota bacterium]|nr:T9SS type A sorting domain-containing protein [Bacteroidota bacterium]